jgi:hypothetical protein
LRGLAEFGRKTWIDGGSIRNYPERQSMHSLDNVIWKALNTSQAHLGTSCGEARKFLKEVSLLGAFLEPSDEAYDSLAELVHKGERVGLFLEAAPTPTSEWKIVASMPLLQMIHEGASSPMTSDLSGLQQLGEADVPEMVALTKLTKPGPFATRTREMGDYFGVREDGALVAMAGERLRLPGVHRGQRGVHAPRASGPRVRAALACTAAKPDSGSRGAGISACPRRQYAGSGVV